MKNQSIQEIEKPKSRRVSRLSSPPPPPFLTDETIQELERRLSAVNGIDKLSELIDVFVEKHYAWIWKKIREGIERPSSVSPLLLKLVDKAKATPQAVKLKSEVFKLVVEKKTVEVVSSDVQEREPFDIEVQSVK
jgi:hypothetical protein